MEIRIDLPDWTKVGPIGPGDEGTDVWPSDAHYKGKAGIYLIETAFPKEGREDWYIGQSGDLLDRFKHYRSAEADPESANTTARVAGKIRECLQNDGEVDLSVMLGAKIAIPDYYYDDDGEDLWANANLVSPTLRLLVESAAIVYKTEAMRGAWETRLNLSRAHKGTVTAPTPLDDLLIEFLAADDTGESRVSGTAA